MIITAGGENIAPQPIHDLVKEQLPIISQVSERNLAIFKFKSHQSPIQQVLLLGDKQKFVSCFLTLAVEVGSNNMYLIFFKKSKIFQG